MKIALVTYKADPELTQSDTVLKEALARQGAEAKAQAWDDTSVTWSEFDGVVLRSCWDYHERPDEFGDWIKRLQKDGINLWNPPAMVLGNMHKRYLLDLEKQGINIVPTMLLGQGQPVEVTALKDKGWQEIVAKPAIGASAFKIFGSSVNAPDLAEKLASLAADQDVLVQPLMSEVKQVGEYSSMFFDGVYSHTVLKKPKNGDFRSNYEQGGSSELVEQNQDVLTELQQVMNTVRPTPLYARVDYLLRGGRPVLMELELIEPSLYMDLYPQAAETFAKTILKKIES